MDETSISVRLTPRAAADRIEVLGDGSLAVRVTAPAVDGRANEALRRTVAKKLGVAPSRVTLVRGQRSRDKVLRIEGLDADAVRRALGEG
jgi:uncharacterized protein (TIGR00251 family)